MPWRGVLSVAQSGGDRACAWLLLWSGLGWGRGGVGWGGPGIAELGRSGAGRVKGTVWTETRGLRCLGRGFDAWWGFLETGWEGVAFVLFCGEEG